MLLFSIVCLSCALSATGKASPYFNLSSFLADGGNDLIENSRKTFSVDEDEALPPVLRMGKSVIYPQIYAEEGVKPGRLPKLEFCKFKGKSNDDSNVCLPRNSSRPKSSNIPHNPRKTIPKLEFHQTKRKAQKKRAKPKQTKTALDGGSSKLKEMSQTPKKFDFDAKAIAKAFLQIANVKVEISIEKDPTYKGSDLPPSGYISRKRDQHTGVPKLEDLYDTDVAHGDSDEFSDMLKALHYNILKESKLDLKDLTLDSPLVYEKKTNNKKKPKNKKNKSKNGKKKKPKTSRARTPQQLALELVNKVYEGAVNIEHQPQNLEREAYEV